MRHYFNGRSIGLIGLALACFSQLFAQQPASPLLASYETHSKMKATSPYGLEWISLGPVLNGARVEAVQADPANPGTLYTAFGSGGLWKSTNNGRSWKPIFENKPSLGIGDFALAPSNPEIIYVGTGESLKKARNFTMPGTGIYRSDDGGKNWVHLGLNDAWHIGEIAVHPENPDIVVVAAQGHFWTSNENRGIYRTEDGGKTWDHVLYLDENTGANDIVYSRANPDVLYASLWENNPDVKGAKSGVFKSEDGGKSWKKIVNGITITESTGRIGVAASWQDADKAYVFVNQRGEEKTIGTGEVYKTIDGGQNWTRTHVKNIKALSNIGWYFMDIYVNPQDDEEIYGLGVRMIHSTDGGKTFDFIAGEVTHIHPSPAQTLHLDHCELWINPKNPRELLLGNDGGLYHSYDRGKSWLHLNNIPTGEFYDIELNDQQTYTIYGGTQDDATVYGPSREFNPKFDDPWRYLWIDAWSGGDGCITLVDPSDNNTVYFSMQHGNARRLDVKKGRSVWIRPRFSIESNIIPRYNFITPYMLDPHNPSTVLMGGNYFLQSDDRGTSWTILSPDLISLGGKQHEIAAGAIAVSPLDKNVLYFGTDRGSFWTSRDRGQNWTKSHGEIADNYIRSIHPSHYKKGRVYMQMTGINYDDLGAYLYVSEDYGRTWKSIVSNLPDHSVNFIMEDPENEKMLFAGTYRGVYVSTDRGGSWSYLGVGLPDTSIADIVIDANSKDMVIGTHGRGIYKTNLVPFYQSLKRKKGNALYAPPAVKAPVYRDTHRDVDEASLEKATISFYLQKSEEITLYLTHEGRRIWEHKIAGKKGLNQFRWDLVVETEDSDNPYFVHYRQYLRKGSYGLTMLSSTGEDTVELHITERNQ